MIRRLLLPSTLALLAIVSTTRADSIIEYEMTGQPGGQATTAATFSALGSTAADLARGPGLTGSTGANSMNASGWNGPNADDYFVFGFDVDAGYTATVDTLVFATRSSNTGPGFVDVLYSVDGGAEVLVTTIAQVGTAYSNSLLNVGSIAVASSFRVFLRSANNTSANGGTVGSAGTLRIGDYLAPGGTTFVPITVGGTLQVLTVVPEPSTLTLLVFPALAGLVAFRRRAATA